MCTCQHRYFFEHLSPDMFPNSNQISGAWLLSVVHIHYVPIKCTYGATRNYDLNLKS